MGTTPMREERASAEIIDSACRDETMSVIYDAAARDVDSDGVALDRSLAMACVP